MDPATEVQAGQYQAEPGDGGRHSTPQRGIEVVEQDATGGAGEQPEKPVDTYPTEVESQYIGVSFHPVRCRRGGHAACQRADDTAAHAQAVQRAEQPQREGEDDGGGIDHSVVPVG